MAGALFAFVHFAAVLGVFGALVGEWLVFGRTPTLAQARQLQQLDRLYGVSAAVVLVAGGVRAYRFEKGLDYYLANPFFHLKLTLFVLVGLLSVYPTIVFIGWRGDVKARRAPVVTEAQHAWITRLLEIELVALLAIVACASLMAKGVGR